MLIPLRSLALLLSLTVLLIPAWCSASDQVTALEGTWLVELNSYDIGLVRTKFTFSTSDSTFTAYTRKGADRDVLGFWTSSLARTFTKHFKHGSLVRITDGIVSSHSDSLLLKGIFRSAMGSYYFNGWVHEGVMTAQLTNSRKESRGFMSALRSDKKGPFEDYPAVVAEALGVAKQKIFSPRIEGTREWKQFEDRLYKAAARVQDDVELVFAFFHYASDLPISHFALLKVPEGGGNSPTAGSTVTLEEKNEHTAFMKISSFGGSKADMDSVLSLIVDRGYQDLIVDLRNNAGGSVEAAMPFAMHMVDSTLIGGVFLTQAWFATHDLPPTPAQYAGLPYFTQASYDLIIAGIHKEQGLVLKVFPAERPYTGRLFIITNNRTASTCEPLVYGLQQAGRATIVGERTAGAMLNGERFALSNGFSVIVPTADYYAVDGYRIDQKGVMPDIVIKPDDAFEHIMNVMIGR